MKKRIAVLFVVFTMLLTACGTDSVKVTETPAPTATPEPTPSPEEIFLDSYINTNERPIAVMVDNDDKNARPHAGLNEAYLIYEMVVEGGSTRFMALYKNADTAKIGPVRSSRHYFLDYVMENDAIYTHFGWSPKAASDISAFKIEKINGILGTDGDTFWREEKYKGDWHSAYTSIANIKEKAEKKGYGTETEHKNGIQYADAFYTPASANVANKVTMNYSYHYETGYNYNPETGLYEKTINDAPHVMQNGETLTVKNILVELIYDTALGDGTARRNIKTTGSGKGYYITNGVYEEITWEKDSRQGNTVYKHADGSTLKINPGKTIINIVNPASGVVFE